jgi:hypothetical protein
MMIDENCFAGEVGMVATGFKRAARARPGSMNRFR